MRPLVHSTLKLHRPLLSRRARRAGAELLELLAQPARARAHSRRTQGRRLASLPLGAGEQPGSFSSGPPSAPTTLRATQSCVTEGGANGDTDVTLETERRRLRHVRLGQTLATEEQIESAVESAPELLGMDVIIIGRQTLTPSGPLDLLAIDGDGRLVVVENKRNRTPREVLAQTIDYAAWVSTLTFDEVESIYSKYQAVNANESADLAEDFAEHFGEQLDAIAEVPRMVIVAAHLDDATERMIDFLTDSFGVPVNAVLFQPFQGGLIGRTWLRPDIGSSRSAGKRSTSNTASRDQAQTFWDAWLPVGRPILNDIKLPQSGPRSVLIKRRVIHGVPAAVVVWVSASEAYAEIQFDDDEPAVNALLLQALQQHKAEIETAYGETLDWRGLDTHELMTKRTKVVASKVSIGDRVNPVPEGLHALAASARRLVDAVKPFLSEALDTVNASLDDDEVVSDDGLTSALPPNT